MCSANYKNFLTFSLIRSLHVFNLLTAVRRWTLEKSDSQNKNTTSSKMWFYVKAWHFLFLNHHSWYKCHKYNWAKEEKSCNSYNVLFTGQEALYHIKISDMYGIFGVNQSRPMSDIKGNWNVTLKCHFHYMIFELQTSLLRIQLPDL